MRGRMWWGLCAAAWLIGHICALDTTQHASGNGEVPSPPRGVTVLSVSRDSALLGWERPILHGLNVTEYRLQMAVYPVESKEHAFTNADFSGKCRLNALNCTVSGLTPGRKYRFRTRAGIDGSFSLFSSHLDFTFPTVPPTPGAPISTEASVDSLTLAWEPPLWSLDHPHANSSMLSPEVLAPVLGYEIETGEGPASPLHPTFREASNQTRQTLSDLKAGTLYRFRLRAWNVIGYSAWSDVGAAFTSTNIPGPPQALSFSNIGITEVDVDWAPPEDGSSVSRYDLLMVQRDGKALKNAELAHVGGGGTTHVTLTALHPGWQYGFRVRAHNGNGAGPFGKIATVRMLDPEPNQPPPPTAIDTTPTTMRVAFQPSLNASGAVIKTYELQVAQEFSDTHIAGYSDSYRGPRRSYLLKSLVVGGCYRFRVRVLSDTNTVSPWSHDGRACTLPTEPAKPLQPHVVNSTTTSLTVRWSPPADHHSEIVLYHLEMEGAAQQPIDGGADPRHRAEPVSVASHFSRVYSGSTLEYTTHALIPDTVYTFRVVAENGVGESSASNTSTGRTKPLLPDIPPPPSIVFRGAKELTVGWAPAEPSRYQTLPVDSMELQAAAGSPNTQGVVLWSDVYSGAERGFTLGSLSPDSGYLFRVRSTNAMGNSEWSHALSVVTTTSPPAMVETFLIEEKSPEHVVVSWDPPKNNGEEIRNYVVEIALEAAPLKRHLAITQSPELGEFKVVQTGTRTSVKLLAGLHFAPSQLIGLRVRALNAAGEGPFSVPFVFWSKPDASGLPLPPDQVRRPQLSLVSSTGCVVHWDRPDGNGAPLSHFAVEVAEVDDQVCERYPVLGKPSLGDCKELLLEQTVPVIGQFQVKCETMADPQARVAAALSCAVTGLDPGAKYMLRVVADNFVGRSFASPPALLALYDTGHGVPATPTRPVLAHADTSSVLLRWTTDLEPGTGTSVLLNAYDVGVAAVPVERIHQLMTLDRQVTATKRALVMAQHGAAPTENPTELATELTRDEVEMDGMLSDLPFVLSFRTDVDDPAGLQHRVEGLLAGGAYAFAVRGVDGNGVGEWSEAVFVQLSADVPAPPLPPSLVEARSDVLEIEVRCGNPQGSPVLESIVQMSIVEDQAAGKWSKPRPLIRLLTPASGSTNTTALTPPTNSSEAEMCVYRIVVTDIPPSTPFAFRVASRNAIGMGPYGEIARFYTAHSPPIKAPPPELKAVGEHSIALQFRLPHSPSGPQHTVIPPVPGQTMPHAIPAGASRWRVSGTEFLYSSHQQLGMQPPPQAVFHAVANVAVKADGSREFVTVCNVTKPGCILENLRAHKPYKIRVRVVEPWGAGDWSEITSTMTLPSQPDFPTRVTAQVRDSAGVRLSWTPPEANGSPIDGFEVFIGAVPSDLQQYIGSVVATREPWDTRRMTVDGLGQRPYLLTGTVPIPEAARAADPRPDEVEASARRRETPPSVARVPNPLSPEAVATADQLPLPKHSATDAAKAQEPEDFEEADDVTLTFIESVARNVSRLEFEWQVPVTNTSHIPTLYVARVRAVNKRGAGPLSPIYRFYAAHSSSALPPNQPLPPVAIRSRPTALTIEWDAPQDNGAPVYGYVLRMLVGDLDPSGQRVFQDVYVGEAATAEITGLVPDQTYHFYVIARNSVGDSPPSNLARIRTFVEEQENARNEK